MRYLLVFIFILKATTVAAMPVDGPDLPKKGRWKTGAEINLLFEKEMKRPKGKLKSEQYYTTLSYGLLDWLSLDCRLGAGNLSFDPKDGEKINYNTSFAGGYGARCRLTQPKENDINILLAFQHISVHPDARKQNNIKNEIFLDYWQGSLIFGKRFGMLTPYTAVKYCKSTLSRRTSQRKDRKRAGSVDRVGLAVGADLVLRQYLYINVESRFFDSKGINLKVSWKF